MERDVLDELLDLVHFKVICILSAYRRMLALTGSVFVRNVMEYRLETVSDNFLILVETGHEKLDEYEIAKYADYIGSYLGYDLQKFYDELYEQAEKMNFSENQKETYLSILHVISKITEEMEK